MVHLPECPKKILVILLSEMGSIVLARPMFNHIREKYPQSELYVLLFERNREVLELLGVALDNHIFSVRDKSFYSMLWDSFRVLKKLKKTKIDTVIDCELFSRISSLYSFLSGAKIRVGFHPYTQEGLYRGDFINRPVLYNPYHHISQQFITLAEAIVSENVPAAKRRITEKSLNIPLITIDKSESDHFFRKFQSDFPVVKDKELILIYPGGGLLPIRAWPIKSFCRVARDFIDNGYAVGIIGIKNHETPAQTILSYCNSDACIDLTGFTRTVKELLVMFHFAALLITNDGGPSHFASMTPLPVITLYGPESPILYGPLNPNSHNFYLPMSCSPCLTAYNHRNSPCDGNNLCLKRIDPEEVLSKAYEMMRSLRPDS